MYFGVFGSSLAAKPRRAAARRAGSFSDTWSSGTSSGALAFTSDCKAAVRAAAGAFSSATVSRRRSNADGSPNVIASAVAASRTSPGASLAIFA